MLKNIPLSRSLYSLLRCFSFKRNIFVVIILICFELYFKFWFINQLLAHLYSTEWKKTNWDQHIKIRKARIFLWYLIISREHRSFIRNLAKIKRMYRFNRKILFAFLYSYHGSEPLELDWHDCDRYSWCPWIKHQSSKRSIWSSDRFSECTLYCWLW